MLRVAATLEGKPEQSEVRTLRTDARKFHLGFISPGNLSLIYSSAVVYDWEGASVWTSIEQAGELQGS